MKLIIEFAYTDFVPVTQENVQELFVTADRFNVMGIIEACSNFLVEQLNPHNCIGIWRFTDNCYYPEMKNKAFQFLLNHFEVVGTTSEEFLQLSAQELGKIIENDQLIVKKEKTVFEAILRWVTNSTEERREHISLLLSKVRLALMPPEYVIKSVDDNEVMKSSEECRKLLRRALENMLDIRTKDFSNSIICYPLAYPRLPAAVLLAIGGWSGEGPTNGIESYDVCADCWVKIPDNELTPRAYHGTAFLNGSVYCVGGTDNIQQLSTVQRFDLGTHTWQEVAPMHSRRCFVCVTVLDGYIYAMGGYDGRDRLSTAERYKPRTNQWTLIASMNARRGNACCTTLQGKIYICGGSNGSECLLTAECYTPETNQWTMIAAMGKRRSGIGVVTYSGYVFAVGGFDGTARLRTVEAYNPDTDTWSDMPSMVQRRSNYGIAVIDDRLFVVGGFNGFSTTVGVESYNIEADHWSYVPEMKISRSALSCCVVYGLTNIAEYVAPRPSLQVSEVEEGKVV
ncbi:Kelch-like protein 10 [Channa argus]|uniref:Kelch-like protein 10 n=1 Tax=Channa argus TaxID=215402 RepID=A0A6G1Q2H2_CHAAH|nr:Kelch-like protein 10 [Channa argus]